MNTTLNNYSRERGDVAANQMLIKIVELVLTHDIGVDARVDYYTLPPVAAPFTEELFAKTAGGVELVPPHVVTFKKPPALAETAEVDMLVENANFNGGSYKILKDGIERFFREVAWDAFTFDFEIIEVTFKERSEADQRQMMADLTQALQVFTHKENSPGDLEEGDLVVLPRGIGGTKIQHAIHAIVKEVLPRPFQPAGSPDRHNLVLLTLDALGRPFLMYSNRNHAELVLKGKR